MAAPGASLRERPAWAAKYVGWQYVEPYGCLVLVGKVLREQFGFVEIPDVTGTHCDGTLRSRAAALAEQLQRWCHPVPRKESLPGDVVAIGPETRIYHVGILVARDQMLHCSEEIRSACIEDIRSLKWQGRVAGFFRLNLKR